MAVVMYDKLRKYWNFLIGKELNISLEHRILIAAILIGLIINIFGLIINLITATSDIAIFLPFAILPLVFYLYYQVRFKSNHEKYAIPIFVLGMVTISIIWIFDGGIDGSNQMTMFTILAIGIVIIPNKYKKYTLFLYIFLSTIIYYIQYFHSYLIIPFLNLELKIIDHYVTLLFTSTSLYFLIYFLYNSYQNEHNKLTISKEKLNLMNENLINVNATREKFFSIIAHDLRNPIFNFYVVTDLLVKEFKSLTDDEKLEFLELSRDSSKNLHLMLENLLTLVKSNQGIVPLAMNDLSLKHILIGNIDINYLQAKNKDIELINNYQGNCAVYVDRNYIDTIIRNLLSNSIKFTPNSGKIEIDVDENYDEKYLLIKISDNGIGIEKAILNQLFQLDNLNSTSGTNNEIGSGLGLLLCKEFVEKIGGKIWVDSEVGKGTTFFFTVLKSNKIFEE